MLRVQRPQGHPRSGSSSPCVHRGALATRLLRSCWADDSPTSQGAETALQAASLQAPSSFRVPAPLITPSPPPPACWSACPIPAHGTGCFLQNPQVFVIFSLKRLHTKGAVGAAKPLWSPLGLQPAVRGAAQAGLQP